MPSERTLTTIMIGWCWLNALFFVGYYHIAAAWWKSEEGRHFMAFGSAMLLLFSSLFAFRVFGDYPGRIELVLFGTLLISLILPWRNWILWKAQHDETPRRRSSDPGGPSL